MWGLIFLYWRHWRNFVQQHRQKQHHHLNHTHDMLYFIIFFMTANKMLPQHLHTSNASLNCWINAKFCLKIWVHYGKIKMAVPNTTDVPQNYFCWQFFTRRVCYCLPRCECTRTRKFRWLMASMPLTKKSLPINIDCEIHGWKIYDTYMVIHSSTSTEDVILAR